MSTLVTPAPGIPSPLLEPEEVAAILRVKINTLAQWRVKGGGPSFLKIGRCVRYRASDLDAWIDAQCRASTCDDRSSFKTLP
jgi:predicted DNA-binding transcriptional regulator AlpA